MRGALPAAIVVHLLLSAGYVAAIPLFEAPDEPDHFRYAQVVATSDGLPVHRGHAERLGRHFLDECGLAHHPPLYYGLLAAALAALDAEDLVVSLPLTNDRAPEDRRRSWRFGHGYDELPPWSAEVIDLRLLRGLSVALGAITLLLIHRLGRTLLPDRPAVADLAVLLAATLPAWSYAHGVLDNGNLATTLVHLALLLGAGGLVGGAVRWPRALALAAVTAAALLSKLTALGLALPLGFLVAASAVRPLRRGSTLVRAGVALAIVGAATGWFFLRNAELYGDPLGAQAHAEVFHRSLVPEDRRLDWLTSGLPAGLLRSATRPNLLPDPVPAASGVALALVALAGLGGLVGLVGAGRRERAARTPASHRAYLALAAAGTLAIFLKFNLQFAQPQARYLLPAAGPFALLLASGLTRLGLLLPARARRPAGVLFGGALAALAATLLIGRVGPDVAVLEVPEGTPTAVAVGVSGRPAGPDEARVELLSPADGARLDAAPTFRWRPDADAPDGTSFVRVVDRRGRVVLDSLAHLGLTGLRTEWALPAPYWETLPAGEELRWFVRRAPDRRAGEATVDQPASPARSFVRRP